MARGEKFVIAFRVVDDITFNGKSISDTHPFVKNMGMRFLFVADTDDGGVVKLHGKYPDSEGGYYAETIELGEPFKIPKTTGNHWYYLKAGPGNSISLEKLERI